MTVEYRPAVVANEIGDELIPQFHDHLLGARIEYVFRSEAAKSNGRVVLGRAKKVTGLNAWLASDVDEGPLDPQAFFVIELAEDEWVRLNEKQRRALVDHELSHCYAEPDDDGVLKLSTRGHDLEEFTAIVRRHGLWKADVQHFVKVGAEQLAIGNG